VSSTERDAGETTRDDQANSSSAAGRTKTIDRTRPDDELDGGDKVSTEVVRSIDPLLPPITRPSENGNGNGHVETLDAPVGGDDEANAEKAAPAKVNARVAEPTTLAPERPTPAPPPPPVVHAAPPAALTDTSNPIPIVTRRATVVGAERHLIAPVHRAIGRRNRVRKVTRVVRHVDPWTVFKVAAIFSLVVYGVLLTAGVLLWNVANTTGTVDNLERFFESFGWEQFEFNGGQIYHAAWIAGLFGALALTGFAVLGATLFNLITDLVGGVRFTVLEEEVVEKTASPMRRFTVRRTETDPTPAAGSTLDEQR
jgi:hypothetical protein